MANKWVAFIVFVYLVAAVLGSTYDHRSDLCSAGSDGETHCYETTAALLGDVRNLIVWHNIGIPGYVSFSIPIPTAKYVETLFNAMTLRFGFFYGDWNLAWALIFLPLALAAFFGFITWAIQIFQGFIP